jgi:putative membrane protein
VFLVLGGLLFFLVRFVVRYYRFRLIRSGNVLSRAHGLFTVQSSSLARDRIQALKVEEGLLRRWLGLAALWADSGGDRTQVDDEKNRDPFVPVAARADAFRLVKQALVDLPDPEPEWTRVSRLAIRRGSRVGGFLLLLAMLPNFIPFGWLALAFLPGFPLIYFLNVQWYRNAGYWIDDYYLISRKGWLNRRTLYLPIRNLQSVSVKQSWFDRRLRLAKLKLDTAGQSNTGGGSVIRNIPVDVARSIQADLARRMTSLVP